MLPNPVLPKAGDGLGGVAELLSPVDEIEKLPPNAEGVVVILLKAPKPVAGLIALPKALDEPKAGDALSGVGCGAPNMPADFSLSALEDGFSSPRDSPPKPAFADVSADIGSSALPIVIDVETAMGGGARLAAAGCEGPLVAKADWPNFAGPAFANPAKPPPPVFGDPNAEVDAPPPKAGLPKPDG